MKKWDRVCTIGYPDLKENQWVRVITSNGEELKAQYIIYEDGEFAFKNKGGKELPVEFYRLPSRLQTII